MMTSTTTECSDALVLVEEAYEVIVMQDDDYYLVGVALTLLQTLGSLTDEWPLESFTDEEIELITESTGVCLQQLMTTHEQGEC